MRVGSGVQTDGTTLKPEVSLAASPLVAPAYGRRCVGLRPTPKIPAHARKTSGTQRTCFFVFLCFSMFSLIFLCFPCFPFFPVLLHVFLCFPCFSSFCPGLICFPTLSLVFLGFPFFFCFLMLSFVFPVSLPSQLFYKILQHSVNFYMILRNIYYKFHTFIKLYIIS